MFEVSPQGATANAWARGARPGLAGAAAMVLSAMLAACGGGDAPGPQDTLAAFTQQKLDWQACDAQLSGEQQQQWLDALGERARCALLRVPLDYDSPAQGELQIELLRVAAAQPQRRLGVIAVNPGGPGSDGLAYTLDLGTQWASAGTDDASGLGEMGNRYDLVGFSPRGVGASNPLICDLPRAFEEQDSLTFDRSADNLQRAQNNARLQAQACLDNPLSRHIHTDATARDMDLMRAVLGEARLHYIGYSYGTWLGSWYARLFPQHVGHMLLDSSLNMRAPLDDQFALQEMAQQRILDTIMLPYAERHGDKLGLGSAAMLREALLALPAPLKEALFEDLDFVNSTQIEANVLKMSAAIGLGAVARLHPDAEGQALQALVQSHAYSPDPRVNAAVAQFALDFMDTQDEDDNTLDDKSWLQQDAQGRQRLLPEFTVNMSIRCNDSGTRGDAQYWLGVSHDHAARYPMVGGATVSKPCVHWPAPARALPPMSAMQGLPILMLQSRFDGATPVESALATLADLPGARMILVENEYQHGLYPYGTACVDAQVAAYFLQGRLPQRISHCAGSRFAAAA